MYEQRIQNNMVFSCNSKYKVVVFKFSKFISVYICFYISTFTCFYISSIRIYMIKNQFLSGTLFRFCTILFFGPIWSCTEWKLKGRTGGDYTQLKKILKYKECKKGRKSFKIKRCHWRNRFCYIYIYIRLIIVFKCIKITELVCINYCG